MELLHMLDVSAKILLVEDEPEIRITMSTILSVTGYSVRTAEDGLSALHAIRQEMPDILLSDLYMPRMTGFELLSVVRQRFPELQVVAMSGAYSGMEIPYGVSADAFYAKDTGIEALLQILRKLCAAERTASPSSSKVAPLWIYQEAIDSPSSAHVTIVCPECLRTSSLSLDGSVDHVRVTRCAHCDLPIHFAITTPLHMPRLTDSPTTQISQEQARTAFSQYYY